MYLNCGFPPWTGITGGARSWFSHQLSAWCFAHLSQVFDVVKDFLVATSWSMLDIVQRAHFALNFQINLAIFDLELTHKCVRERHCKPCSLYKSMCCGKLCKREQLCVKYEQETAPKNTHFNVSLTIPKALYAQRNSYKCDKNGPQNNSSVWSTAFLGFRFQKGSFQLRLNNCTSKWPLKPFLPWCFHLRVYVWCCRWNPLLTGLSIRAFERRFSCLRHLRI